jgi:hypothetical protein
MTVARLSDPNTFQLDVKQQLQTLHAARQLTCVGLHALDCCSIKAHGRLCKGRLHEDDKCSSRAMTPMMLQVAVNGMVHAQAQSTATPPLPSARGAVLGLDCRELRVG